MTAGIGMATTALSRRFGGTVVGAGLASFGGAPVVGVRWGSRRRTTFMTGPFLACQNSTAAAIQKINGIIIGPPGSGKGTISERIVRDFELEHISSGDIIRKHIKEGTKFGKAISAVVASGGLVGTDLLSPLVESELGSCSNKKGWLLDGYPRTVEQADRLHMKGPPNLVIYLNVPFETIIERIKARWVHIPSGRVYNLQFNPPKVPGKDDITGEELVQREDDKPESVTLRLEQYQQSTQPVLEFYRTYNLVHEFQGTESNVIYPYVHNFLNKFSGGLRKPLPEKKF